MNRLILLTWALLLVAAPSLFAADGAYYRLYEVTGTAAAITVEQPSSSAKPLSLNLVYFSCSSTCTVTLEKNGSKSGGASVTALVLDERGAASTSTVTTDSTITSGVTIISDDIDTQKLTYSGPLYLPAVSGTQKSFTASIAAGASSDLKVYVEWVEPE